MDKHLHIFGIAGGSGSGKTTIAQNLAESVSTEEVVLITHDSYYRDQSHVDPAERVKTNYDHPKSLETELLVEHLRALQRGEAINVPVYDFVHHTRSQKTQHVEPKPVIVVEGILLFVSPDLRELFDLKVFVDTPDDIRFIRRMKRDIQERGRTMESVVEQYLGTVRPMHHEFVEPSKAYADIIVPEGGHNARAMELLSSALEHILAS